MCAELRLLQEQYGVATERLAQAVARYGAALAHSPEEGARLQRGADEARSLCADLMKSLQRHRLVHGC